MAGSRSSETLLDVLRLRAATAGDRPALTFLSQGREEAAWSFLEVDRRTRRAAAGLQIHCRPGSRILLLLSPGPDFVEGFLAALYAGLVPVPVAPPVHPAQQERLASVVRVSRPSAILTNKHFAQTHHGVSAAKADLLVLEDVRSTADIESWRPPAITPSSLALLQYTSGSTADPKGVMVQHGNLVANLTFIGRSFGYTAESVSVSWLPPFHDMGLVNGILQPLFDGCRGYLMNQEDFVRSPIDWLSTISRYRGTHSGGPNFAYDLCVAKSTQEQRDALDLECWEIAYNGSEPVRASTIESFSRTFAASGFRAEAMYPCYGLAEATLKVSGGPAAQRPRYVDCKPRELERGAVVVPDRANTERRTLVACGKPDPDSQVLIVDPSTRQSLPESSVGEVWIRGPSVCAGYFASEEGTSRTFEARLSSGDSGHSYLRTGDLGFLRSGQLFICGRIKDLIIVRGRNLHPQDIETSVQASHTALSGRRAAAFACTDGDGAERLVVIHEVRPAADLAWDALNERIRSAVVAGHGVSPMAVVLVEVGSIPRTTSGKVRRTACRQAYRDDKLSVLSHWSAFDSSRLPEADEVWPADLSLEEIELRLLAMCRLRLPDVSPDPSATPEDLGLDSLAVAELGHCIEKQAGTVLPPEALHGHSLSELAQRIATSRREPDSVLRMPGNAGDATAFRCGHGQRAIWFMSSLQPEKDPFVVTVAMRLIGAVDIARLESAFYRVARHHSELFSRFEQRLGEAWQSVGEPVNPPFVRLRAGSESAAERERAIVREVGAPFDLRTGPLIRAGVVEEESAALFALGGHHIVADLLSLRVLLRQIAAVYTDPNHSLPAAGPHPASVAEHETAWLNSRAGERASEHWSKELAGASMNTVFPVGSGRSSNGRRGRSKRLKLPVDLCDELAGFCRGERVTQATAMLAAFVGLIHRYTGASDILVSTPCSLRDRADLAEAVGLFVNPLLIRVRLSDGATGRSLLNRTQAALAAARRHGNYPFALVVQQIGGRRTGDQWPTLPPMFVVQQAGDRGDEPVAAMAHGEPDVAGEMGDLSVRTVTVDPRWVHHDLLMMIGPNDEGLTASVQHSAAAGAFHDDQFLQHYLSLLQAMLTLTDTPIADWPVASSSERQLLLETWSGSDVDSESDATIHELVLRQCVRVPAATAVAARDESLTYEQLEQWSRRIANQLRRRGVAPESRVGVCMERTPAMVAALLGVLRAGGAYVPLALEYPAERRWQMAESAGVRTILTDEREDWPSWLDVLEVSRTGATDRSDECHEPRVDSSNLAYVLFTSGSTGSPKGVAIEHRAAVAMLQWAQQSYSDQELSRVLAGTSTSFDLSVFELFAPLIGGHTVVLAANQLDVEQLAMAPTLINCTPSAMAEIVSAGTLPPVLTVNLAGERLPVDLVRRIHELAPEARIVDLYGPTEDCTYSTCCERSPTGVESIGRPLPGTRVYLLDRDFAPVPIGTPGEIYLGGVGNARGYIGRPGLTAERFVPDPLGGEDGARLYRTGDLARFLPDGRLAFLGRIDRQVKLRGFRVEPEEVESTLRQVPDVVEAAVIADDQSDRDLSLTAHIVVETGIGWQSVRNQLGRVLPDFMIPGRFVVWPRLPRLANGKIDLGSLREARPGAGGGEALRGREPATETEIRLAGLWAEVLGGELPDLETDFLDAGGHSLTAARLVARIREEFGVELPVTALFLNRTVEAIAVRIDTGAAVRSVSIPRARPIDPSATAAATPTDGLKSSAWLGAPHDRTK